MKLLSFLTITLLLQTAAFGQSDTAVTAPIDSAVNKSTLTIGVLYADNANYYGQEALEKTPYAALAANYKLKCGLYFSALGYRLLHDSSNIVSAGSAGLGFAMKISKRFSADISYTHSFYAGFSPLLQASNRENGSITLEYDNFLDTKITGDYAFGTSSDAFVTLGTGKQITLGHASKKDIISITPAADVVAGTQHFYQTYIEREKLRDSVLGILFAPITGQSPGGTNTKSTSSTQVNLLSYNFKCPLDYSRAHYMIEVACQLSLLSNKAQINPGKFNSFISAAFYYQF